MTLPSSQVGSGKTAPFLRENLSNAPFLGCHAFGFTKIGHEPVNQHFPLCSPSEPQNCSTTRANRPDPPLGFAA